MKKSLTLLSLILFVNAHAQTVSPANPTPSTDAPKTTVAQDEPKWDNYFYPGEEFVVMLPHMPSVILREAHKRDDTTIADMSVFGAYMDDVVYVVVALEAQGDGGKLGSRIEAIKKVQFPYAQLILKKEVKDKKSPVRHYDVRTPDTTGVARFYGTSKRTYMIAAVGASETHPAVERFLQSFTLGTRTFAKEIADAQPFSHISGDVGGSNVGDEDKPLLSKDVTRKAIIVIRPEASFTPEARRNNTSGIVRVHGVLMSSGKVKVIRVVKPLPDGLAEKSIDAFSKIKFIPATKDGRRVSQYLTMEYNFNVF